MIRLFFFHHGTDAARYLSSQNIFGEFGEDCAYHTKIIPSEPELVKIHNNVHVAAGVKFITHDIICDMFNRHPKYKKYAPWPFYRGTIEIKDNCMIGANSTLMYNTIIGPNVIIAAGSVITKNVPDGEIWGGVPARCIGYIDDLAKKRLELEDE